MSSSKLKDLIIPDDYINENNINNFICKACEDIAQSPVLCQKCKATYCNDCADTYKNKKKNCQGNDNIENNIEPHILSNYKADDGLEDIITNQIIFRCKNKSCDVKGNISEISFHLIDCNLIEKTCPNENCDFKGNDHEIDEHVKYSCIYGRKVCQVCNQLLNNEEQHSCMVKFVEEITNLELLIEEEKKKLNNIIQEKKEILLKFTRDNSLSKYFCKKCNKSTIIYLGKNVQNDTRNHRFRCETCMKYYSIRGVYLIKTENCFCGRAFKTVSDIDNEECESCLKKRKIDHYCDNCNLKMCGPCLH
jgi:hypothetical protein